MQTKADPVPQDGKKAPTKRHAWWPLRSRTVNTATCVAGLVTTGIGLFGVLAGPRGAFDMVFLIGGLLVTLVGLVLLGRSPRT